MPSNFHQPFMRSTQMATATFYRMWSNVDRLTNVHFGYTLLIAFILHLMFYGIWHLMPRPPIMNIPVRVLNIKLADFDDVPNYDLSSSANAANQSSVENVLASAIKSGEKTVVVKPVDIAKKKKKNRDATQRNLKKMAEKSKHFSIRKEGKAVAAPVMSVVEKQYVRAAAPAPIQLDGHKLGTSVTTEAEVVSRYEQLISAWVNKFKPDQVEGVGQPDKATANVRIRIDRRGNVRYMELDKSTDFMLLDRAAINTVRRANPVPAVPADYPAGDIVEFIIPITFIK